MADIARKCVRCGEHKPDFQFGSTIARDYGICLDCGKEHGDEPHPSELQAVAREIMRRGNRVI